MKIPSFFKKTVVPAAMTPGAKLNAKLLNQQLYPSKEQKIERNMDLLEKALYPKVAQKPVVKPSALTGLKNAFTFGPKNYGTASKNLQGATVLSFEKVPAWKFICLKLGNFFANTMARIAAFVGLSNKAKA